MTVGSGFERVFEAERAEIRQHARRRGAIVEVTGVGFFDYYIDLRAGRRTYNGLELHPVIGLRFLTDAEQESAGSETRVERAPR